MTADVLADRVRDFFRVHATAFGLDARSLVVEYVLNHGGFVNWSYRISDRQTRYHVKLATSADGRRALERWQTIAPLLGPYHAPPVLDWIDVEVAAGLLFPVVAGKPPALSEDVVDEVFGAVQRLNADVALRDRVAAEPLSARDAYLGSFHDRFTEDLRGIRSSPPQFVDTAHLQWLEHEVERLADIVRAAPAFDEQLTGPVHGDVWLDNILWVSRDEWHLLDWDDLRIGDPVADLAALTGPSARDVRPLKLIDRVIDRLTDSERDRLRVLGRATLLDWAIDPLSDWIDAAVAPTHAREVRAEKESVHRAALRLYRDMVDE